MDQIHPSNTWEDQICEQATVMDVDKQPETKTLRPN